MSSDSQQADKSEPINVSRSELEALLSIAKGAAWGAKDPKMIDGIADPIAHRIGYDPEAYSAAKDYFSAIHSNEGLL